MVDDYLSYLKSGKEQPSLGFLQRLVTLQTNKVPVENLDFYYDRKPLLDVSRILKKILQGRGAIPLHLNAVFCELLVQLGFSAEIRSSRSYDASSKKYSERLSGIGLFVNIDRAEFFVDVAEVKGLTSVLEVSKDKVMLSGSSYYRWNQQPFDDHLYLSKSRDANTFYPHRQIEPKEIKLIEYLPENDNFQLPGHEVSKQRCMYRRTEKGYVYLKDHELEIVELGNVKWVTVENEEAFWSLSAQHFGIEKDLVFNQEAGT